MSEVRVLERDEIKKDPSDVHVFISLAIPTKILELPNACKRN